MTLRGQVLSVRLFALYWASFLPRLLSIDTRNFAADVVFEPFFISVKVKTQAGALQLLCLKKMRLLNTSKQGIPDVSIDTTALAV